nr:MAG TPA: hypothetical protein [Bacteriophage sp.]
MNNHRIIHSCNVVILIINNFCSIQGFSIIVKSIFNSHSRTNSIAFIYNINLLIIHRV